MQSLKFSKCCRVVTYSCKSKVCSQSVNLDDRKQKNEVERLESNKTRNTEERRYDKILMRKVQANKYSAFAVFVGSENGMGFPQTCCILYCCYSYFIKSQSICLKTTKADLRGTQTTGMKVSVPSAKACAALRIACCQHWIHLLLKHTSALWASAPARRQDLVFYRAIRCVDFILFP